MNLSVLSNFFRFFLVIIVSSFTFSLSVESAIPSVWDYLYGNQHGGGGVDTDGDGNSDTEEKLHGTDPLSSNSALSIQFIDHVGSAIIAKWNTKKNKIYQPQVGLNPAGPWSAHGGALTGNGDEFSFIVPSNLGQAGFFRLKIGNLNNKVSNFTEIYPSDSDGDGVSDYQEFVQGSSPTEVDKSCVVKLVKGSGRTISWNSVKGKYYQVKYKVNEVWIDYGSIHAGTGGVMYVLVCSVTDELPELKLEVSDRDSDSDGINDWDELQLGLDPDSPRTNIETEGDAEAAAIALDVNNSVSVEAIKPFANVTTLEQSGFKIKRVKGSKALTIRFNISGTAVMEVDYQTIPYEVTLPFGVNEVTVPVVPMAGSGITSPRTVYMIIQPEFFTVSGSHVKRINIIKENLINVKDYGAVGDGVTDDAPAIQSAIHALEVNPIKNTLYFPSGTYLLNTLFSSAETNYNTKRILKLGNLDLAGRDIILKGDANSELYSAASPDRAHMLVAMTSFRSLTVSNLIFKQSDVLLNSSSGAQGSDGVSVVRVDSREVERISFQGVEFNNCHGSVFFYNNAYDVRGKLKHVEFLNCNILNPHGANTAGILGRWGGGQQISMGSWVGEARYEGCRFEGGKADMTDHSKAPGGRLKDGSHFGSPLRLRFINNSVKWMGVEAVYQLNNSLYIGTTFQAFTIPAADGATVATVKFRPEEATFVSGQILNIRRPTTGTFAGKNNIFRVVAYRKALNEVDVVNDGHAGNDVPGTELPYLLPAYVQADDSGRVEIRGNVLEGKLPVGAEVTNPTGIVLDSTGVVEGNYITGFAAGVLNYKEASVPLFPGTRKLVVYKNYILMRHPDLSYGPVTYGIETHANEINIGRNQIVCPLSKRSAGIALRGRGAKVFNNQITALVKQVNGYSSSQRSLGVLTGNTSFGTYVYRNTTQNFDVGVGPEPGQWVIHYVQEHTTINDELGVDFRGVVPAP